MNYRKLARGEEVYLTKMEIYNVAPTGVDLKTDAQISIVAFPFSIWVRPEDGTVLKDIYNIPMWKDLAVLLEEKNQNNPNYDNEDKIRTVYFYSTGKTAVVDKTYKLQEAFRILLTLNTSALGLHTGDLIDIGVPQGFPFDARYIFWNTAGLSWKSEQFGVPTQYKVISPNKAIAVVDMTVDNFGATSSPDARDLFVAYDYDYWNIAESGHGDSTYEDNITKESPKYLPKSINQILASALEGLKMCHKAFWYANNRVRIGNDGGPMLNPTWDNVRMYAGKTRTEILNALANLAGTTNIDSLEIVYNDEGDGAAQINEVKNAVVSFAEQQMGICRVVLYTQTYNEYTEGNYDYRYCTGLVVMDGWSGTDWQTLDDYWQDHTEMGSLPKNVVMYHWTPTSQDYQAYLPSQGAFAAVTAYYNHTNTVRRMHT